MYTDLTSPLLLANSHSIHAHSTLQAVQMPVCLDGVKWIIGRGGYTSLFHCASDLITMGMNASTYNEPGSEYNLLGELYTR